MATTQPDGSMPLPGSDASVLGQTQQGQDAFICMFVFVCLLGCSFVIFLSHFEVHHGGHAAGKGPAYSANHSLLTLRCAVLQAALPTPARAPEPATPQVVWSGSPLLEHTFYSVASINPPRLLGGMHPAGPGSVLCTSQCGGPFL